MALIRWTPRRDLWDPFANLADIQQELNRLFDTSLGRTAARGFEAVFAPAIDVVEEKDKYVVKADLPGLTKDDVSVTLEDNRLTIKGEKKQETEDKGKQVYYRERVYGAFSRLIELPAGVDAGKIDARFTDGVLQVMLPKSESAKPKQIEVKVN
jgi:HSP20 family protein